MQFQTLKEKQYHVRSKHGPPVTAEECPICHKTYNKVYLKEHMTTHEESDALKCKECGKKFSSKSNLNKHGKKHLPGYVPVKDKQREKKYSCSDCGKRFDSMHGLEVWLYSAVFVCHVLTAFNPRTKNVNISLKNVEKYTKNDNKPKRVKDGLDLGRLTRITSDELQNVTLNSLQILRL